MKHLNTYTKQQILALTSTREGETKVGEKIGCYSAENLLTATPQRYVLLGIPEDIGVRANYGRAGASPAWDAFLQNVCNMQYHTNSAWDIAIILGTVDCTAEMETASKTSNVEALGKLVTSIDEKVAHIIEIIISAGKIPIIIGGGHNNSFGNCKGTSKALGKPINVINFDPHSDYRRLEHRHSGNGFSYAKAEGYLNKYHIFGFQKNYNSQFILEAISSSKGEISFTPFDALKGTHAISFQDAFASIEQEICQTPFGLEVDLDAIEMMGSSAMSAVGFSIEDARDFIKHFSALETCTYIHLCEGAPALELFPNQVGRTLAYMVSDILE